MADNLYIENGKAHMMYVGQLPWHKLGTPLERPATSAEAIPLSTIPPQRPVACGC